MKNINLEQVNLMLTTLGYNFPNFREGKFVTDRNCFFANEENDSFEDLVKLGLAEKTQEGNFMKYALTNNGIDVAASVLRTEIIVMNV